MYRFVFWQNCLSPHQLPYIAHLLDDKRVYEVVVVTDEVVSPERKKMGWDIPTSSKQEQYIIKVSPSESEILNLLSKDQNQSIHLFSGINAYPFVKRALRLSLNYKIKRGIITERPNTFKFRLANGKPLWLHKIRFYIQDRKYAKHIQYVFAMGDDAVNYFNKLGQNWKVFAFSYCTHDKTTTLPINKTKSDKLNISYIGSLSWWKNPLLILQAIRNIPQSKVSITFIGEGAEKKNMESYINKHKLSCVTIRNYLDNKEIPNFLNTQDILILPSIYDGWGAVINEALTEGVYVICSSNVGAKELLKENWIGCIFNSNDKNQLSKLINNCIHNKDFIINNREQRINWSKQCISGKVISQYMIDCIEGIKTIRPWFRKI